MSYFPYGKAALSILFLTLLSGAYIVWKPPQLQHKATLVYWVFATEHYDDYVKVVPEFEREHPGVTVDLELVSNTALASRLQASFLADLDVPDCCELEIGTAGTMFRGPLKDIGFIDLKPRLIQSGLYNQFVQARFSPYTNRGEIFGLPHDVHPMQIAYRRDIFAKYGIDPNKIKTWADFVAAGHKITIPGKQYMMELSDSDATQLEGMLFQRGGGYFDSQGHCILDNEAAVQTMEFYVPLVAGPNKIGNFVGDSFGATFGQAVQDGYECSFICPDWRSGGVQTNYPHLSGEMALMPFPAVYPGGIRTSTWGGTMVGITKHSAHQELAWELVKFLYTSKPQLVKQFVNTNIIPPVKYAWNDPAYSQPNPFWSNQPLGETYIALANQVPAHYTAPEIDTATAKLSEALIACVKYYNEHGDDAGFDPFVRQTLKEKADRVRAVMARNPY